MELTVGNKQFYLPTEWKDIKVSKAVEIVSAVQIPELLKEAYELDLKGESESAEAKYLELADSEYLAFIDSFTTTLLGKGSDLITATPKDDRTVLYHKFLRKFAIGLYLGLPYDYEPSLKECYSFDDKDYYYPPEVKVIMGNDIPMATATAKEFSDSFDLYAAISKMDNFEWGLAREVVANVLKSPSELDWTLDVFFDVFFCLIGLTQRYIDLGQISLKAMEILKHEAERLATQKPSVGGEHS